MKKARASLWLMLLTICAALFPLGAAAMVLDGTITDAKTQAAVLKVYIKAKG